MRKKFFIVPIVILVCVALCAVFCACQRAQKDNAVKDKVVSVNAAMHTVCDALKATNGAHGALAFNAAFDGNATVDGKIYDFVFAGSFDVTEANLAADSATQLLFEVKQSGGEVLVVYYSDGKLYLHYPPYASRGTVYDFNLAKAVSALCAENKAGGTVAGLVDALPDIASYIFSGCTYTEAPEGQVYKFTLSYSQLFNALDGVMALSGTGLSSADFLAALHLTQADIRGLSAAEAQPVFVFTLNNGVLQNASATVSEAGISAVNLNSFSLQTGSKPVALPAFSAFSEYNLRNLSASGTLDVGFATADNITAINYGAELYSDFQKTNYSFEYEFKSNYSKTLGQALYLGLTDRDGKHAAVALSRDVLYFDLADYGVGKVKLTVEQLKDRLSAAGFYSEAEFGFKDKLRLLALAFGARNVDGDSVSYAFGSEFVQLLSQKIGFKGLFGVDSITLGWDTSHNRLQNLAIALTSDYVTASVTSPAFTFGTPVEVPAPTDAASYVSLAERTTTHISAKGTVSEQTAASDDGAVLAALIGSISGESITFAESYVGLQFEFDAVYDATGKLTTLNAAFASKTGADVLTVYYTAATADKFYLIYPAEGGVSRVRTLGFAADKYSAFNAFSGIAASASGNNRLYATATESAFGIGVTPLFGKWLSERIAAVYPQFETPWITGFGYRRIVATFAADSIAFTAIFDSDNSITATATTFNVTYGDDVNVVSCRADVPESVSLLSEGKMPTVMDVAFAGGTEKRVYLFDYASGESLWRFTGVPALASGGTTTVTAQAELLGYTLSTSLKVSLSSASAVTLAPNAGYTCYDAKTRTFTFALYNDNNPVEVIPQFNKMTVTVDGANYAKTVSWNLANVNTKFGNTFTVTPVVPTCFGTTVQLTDYPFTVNIVGSKAASTDYTLTFTAYDGKNPLDAAVYSDEISVTTEEGGTLIAKNLEWKLDNAEIAARAQAGTLYSYNPAKAPTVKVNVYDCMGNAVALSVALHFVPKVVSTVTFDVSGTDGVSYDLQNGFTFDVLKINSLTSANASAVLPRSMVANHGTENEFEVNGIKWDFDAVANVQNASGAEGTLTLTVGDDVSGYQSKEIAYRFTSLQITATALLDADKQEFATDKGGTPYTYVLNHLSAYAFKYPTWLRVYYTDGDAEATLDIEAAWQFDGKFDANSLYGGGSYSATMKLGSETVSLAMQFDVMRITAYRFTAENLTLEGGAVVPTAEYSGKTYLRFAVTDALNGVGLDYTNASCYPQSAEVQFNGAGDWTKVDIVWDLGCYAAEGRSVIDSGYFGAVNASAAGQTVPVNVYVSALGATPQALSFYLIDADADGKIVTTDPRNASNYPQKLLFTPENAGDGDAFWVDVNEWVLGKRLNTLFIEAQALGISATDVSGSVVVGAKIGNEKTGYKNVDVEVYVVASVIDNITVSGLPYAVSSQLTGGATPYAIDVDYTAGTSGNFNYALSVSLNPYYVIPTDGASYPKYLNFNLNGKPVAVNAKWDLSKVPSDAATKGNAYEYAGYEGKFGYPIYAVIDVGEGFVSKKIGVQVNIQQRIIDKVWIDDSCQRFIDVDCYAEAPFGTDVVGNTVTLDVSVQFAGDSYKYPLKLRYNKQGIVLSYDGSGVYDDVTVEVGNENAGYTEIAGYTLRVLSQIASKIVLPENQRIDGTDGVFYQVIVDADGKVSYNYSAEDYECVVDMTKAPDTLEVTFGVGGAAFARQVPAFTSGAKGLVFDLVRNESGAMCVRLFNASLDGDDTVQVVCNPKQTGYNAPSKGQVFGEWAGADVWTTVYEDETDEGGTLTAAKAIMKFAAYVSTEKFAESRQHRYVTTEEAPSAALDADAVLNAGSYRYYVEIIGDEFYRGAAYQTFTVTPKDITDYAVLQVGGVNAYTAYQYSASGYYVSAIISGYAVVDVPLTVDGEEGVRITDVKYGADGGVVPYTFAVSVAEEVINYVVNTTFEVTVTEASAPASSVAYTVVWNGADEFTVNAVMFEATLSEDKGEVLTNGYVITYYSDATYTSEVTAFTSGETYYYKLRMKVPNYTEWEIGASYQPKSVVATA